MPNPNYIKGRNFEYAVMRHLRTVGYDAMRTAGSHGQFDIVAIHKSQGCIEFIQCKVVETSGEAERLKKAFRKDPPYAPFVLPRNVHQALFVKVSGSSKWEEIYV